jgi:gluconolactonase
MQIHELARGLRFPEGPIALADGSVLLVELEGGTVARVFSDGRVERIATPGGGPNGAAIGPDGAVYICNSGGDRWSNHGEMRLPEFDPAVYGGGRIERVDPMTGAVEVLYDHCGANLLCAPNDLVFDSSGGFWFTDIGKQRGRSADVGAIYYALASGSGIREVLFPVASPNGVALSPDEATLYFAETFTGRIWHYPLAAPGQLLLANAPFDASRLLYRSPGLRMFDSMAVDARGYLYVACLLDAGISVISPQGELESFLPLPDPITTNICFGGPLRCTAYVTLATHGKLISFDVAHPGHALPFDSRCRLKS